MARPPASPRWNGWRNGIAAFRIAGRRVFWRRGPTEWRSHPPLFARCARLMDSVFVLKQENTVLAEKQNEKLYSAEFIGSGTFIISKPKRKRKKLQQSRVKSPQRGARK